MLNSAEHEIFIAHKYENIRKFSIFQAQISLECYFSCSQMLKCQQINICDQEKFHAQLSWAWKKFDNLWAGAMACCWCIIEREFFIPESRESL